MSIGYFGAVTTAQVVILNLQARPRSPVNIAPTYVSGDAFDSCFTLADFLVTTFNLPSHSRFDL